MRLAFIGLGVMGRSMAANLQAAGHDVRAYDIRRVDGFAHFAASAAEAVQGCELVFTSLPGPDEVDAVAAQTVQTKPNEQRQHEEHEGQGNCKEKHNKGKGWAKGHYKHCK